MLTRRAFLGGCLASLTALPLVGRDQRERERQRRRDDGGGSVAFENAAAALRARHADLPNHFIFEYYPWYATQPWRHWDGSGRTPPAEIAASSLPLLGPYDSRSAAVVERHARWIAEAGIGAINLSWWGRGSFEDQAVPLVMDVMRAHDIAVTFHLEPYGPERGRAFASDVAYLLREYGDRRRWDAFLILENADGTSGPLLKTFATLLSPTRTDCRGVTTPAPDYVPDGVWREQTARVREAFARDFDHVTLLADSLDVGRVLAAGFDGGTSADPYLHPDRWPTIAGWFNAEEILFAFAANPGFEGIEPRPVPNDPCYQPPRFDPPEHVDWNTLEGRERAHALSDARIRTSFATTLRLQTDPRGANWRRGFFATYVNSFNEWHEGTQFEPMRPYGEMPPAERALYHNPLRGDYRLATLRSLMQQVLPF